MRDIHMTTLCSIDHVHDRLARAVTCQLLTHSRCPRWCRAATSATCHCRRSSERPVCAPSKHHLSAQLLLRAACSSSSRVRCMLLSRGLGPLALSVARSSSELPRATLHTGPVVALTGAGHGPTKRCSQAGSRRSSRQSSRRQSALLAGARRARSQLCARVTTYLAAPCTRRTRQIETVVGTDGPTHTWTTLPGGTAIDPAAEDSAISAAIIAAAFL